MTKKTQREGQLALTDKYTYLKSVVIKAMLSGARRYK